MSHCEIELNAVEDGAEGGSPNVEAGKDLNYLIAEKFVGLEPWPNANPWKPARLFKARGRVPGEASRPVEAPDYSGRIAAAWTLLERLQRREPVALRSDVTGHWFAEWGKVKASAPTAPLAICLLALKSLEITDEAMPA